jgi:hypothetical protein
MENQNVGTHNLTRFLNSSQVIERVIEKPININMASFTSSSDSFTIRKDITVTETTSPDVPIQLQKAKQFVQTSTWGKACQGLFSELVITSPETLFTLIEYQDMRPTLLGFAAETAGLIEDSVTVSKTLIPLLTHAKFYVREGAVYGLSNHLEFPGIRAKLEEQMNSDPSESVRMAIQEALED